MVINYSNVKKIVNDSLGMFVFIITDDDGSHLEGLLLPYTLGKNMVMSKGFSFGSLTVEDSFYILRDGFVTQLAYENVRHIRVIDNPSLNRKGSGIIKRLQRMYD